MNSQEFETISGNLTTSISDHLPQFMFINKFFNDKNKLNCKSYLKRDFRKFDKTKFQRDFKNINFVELYNLDESNIDNGFKMLIDKVTNLLNIHAPYKNVSHKQMCLQLKSWVTAGIQKSILKRDKIRKIMLKEKKAELRTSLLSEYKRYRNKITELLRKSKKNYYLKFFEENKSNCKVLWEGINEIIHSRKLKTNSSPTSLQRDGRTIFNQKEISNELNKYFTTISKHLQEKIRPSRLSPKDYLTNLNEKTFFLTPTTAEEVSNKIDSLKNGKSLGPNSIPTNILNIIKEEISEPLSHLINISFNKGKFHKKKISLKQLRLFQSTKMAQKLNAIISGPFLSFQI